MGTEMLSDQTLAMMLTGFAVFAGVIALVMPDEPDPRLQARLQSVARERDRLRDRRLADLAVRAKRKIRKDESGIIGRLLRRLRTEERAANGGLAVRLRMAGFRGQGAEAIFLFFRAATPLGLSILALSAVSFYGLGHAGPSSALTFCVATATIGYTLPRLVLDRLIAKRQKTILRAFPDALDLLLICVQSGMSVESALSRVTNDISPQSIELAEELSLTMAELSYLPVRWRAYVNLGDRIGLPAVKLITAALVQAERHGTSISQALTAAAREAREARIAEAERKAAALPPKLAIPLVAFFLPVLLTIILAPAIMEASEAFRQNRASLIVRDLK